MINFTSIENCLLGLFTTVVVIILIKQFSIQIGLVDKPDHRKHHQGEIPVIGGISILISLLITQYFFARLPAYSNTFIFCITLLCVTGAVDDRIRLSVKLRLLVQVAISLLMIFQAGLKLTELGNIYGIGNIEINNFLAIALTSFVCVGIINAINMLDGVDGLAGCIILVCLLLLCFIASILGATSLVESIALLASIVCGFLIFNLRHPRQKRALIFLGDAGSTMLGFILVWFVLDLFQFGATSHLVRKITPITALWIFALPILDAFNVILMRLSSGKSPFAPGRDHIHHCLLNAGISDSKVTLFLSLLSAFFGMLGVLTWYLGVPENLMALTFVITVISYSNLIPSIFKKESFIPASSPDENRISAEVKE